MTSKVPPRDWTDIHWPDISEAGPARWIAVLPLAATEQHGPHLPVGTDVMIAQAYLARVRELLDAAIPATFLPLQPVGISTEHLLVERDDFGLRSAGIWKHCTTCRSPVPAAPGWTAR